MSCGLVGFRTLWGHPKVPLGLPPCKFPSLAWSAGRAGASALETVRAGLRGLELLAERLPGSKVPN